MADDAPRYLLVDGHSVIFTSRHLRGLHQRRSSLGRETLIKQLRNYQDWTGVRVVVVFDGTGSQVDAIADLEDIQIFYSRSGQTADAVIERLASKYAKRFAVTVATSDYLEQQTVAACGAEYMSAEALLDLLKETGGKRKP
ncbi:MAG: NYN domain-containing protein [Spartobacteria bacterium]